MSAAQNDNGALARGAPERPSTLSILLLWAATLSFVAYLVLTTDGAAFLSALASADLLVLLPAVLAFTAVSFTLDVVTLRFLLRATGLNMRRGAVARMRALGYLWQMIHYGLALAFMTHRVLCHTRAGAAAAATPLVLLALADISAISAVLLFGLAVAHPWLPDGLPVAPLVTLALFGLVALPALPHLAGLPWLQRLAGRRGRIALAAVCAVSPQRVLVLLGIRAGGVLLYVLADGVFLHSFGFSVPWIALLVFEPLLLLVMALPIAVSGIGSSQLAMRVFFGDFAPLSAAPEAAVDAFSTTTLLAIIGARLLLALTVTLMVPGRAPPEERR